MLSESSKAKTGLSGEMGEFCSTREVGEPSLEIMSWLIPSLASSSCPCTTPSTRNLNTFRIKNQLDALGFLLTPASCEPTLQQPPWHLHLRLSLKARHLVDHILDHSKTHSEILTSEPA
ncbi:hypothetical protein ATANTOWER_017021 [Ataeniobius toweri]|uniref:Uncharacterized protein n=1 Tax=Ataeniobius toweri TaxID=208326 RepID=A0ABU7C8M3_9TELE|nr:hypothetical protein [Ataeniobius toweri]